MELNNCIAASETYSSEESYNKGFRDGVKLMITCLIDKGV